jgi:hypothetical protein
MKRLLWWIGGNILILEILVGAAWLWFRPTGFGSFTYRTVVAYVGSQHVTVSYQPGKSEALVSVRLDGLGKYRQVEYQVLSSETWAPQWQARMEGRLSEFLTLHNGYSQSPEPMTRDLAEKLARSYKIVLRLEGEEHKFDFSTANVGEAIPLFSITR